MADISAWRICPSIAAASVSVPLSPDGVIYTFSGEDDGLTVYMPSSRRIAVSRKKSAAPVIRS